MANNYRNIIIGLVVMVIIVAGIFYFKNSKNSPPSPNSTSVSTETANINTTKSVNFWEVNLDYKFTANIANEWQVENIAAIDSINIYDPSSPAINNLDKSQIFIRQFSANDFLTLNTVNVLNREQTKVDNHRAVQYEIQKKDGVADFPNQPNWRNGKHKLIDVRYNDNNPSIFYVISYNPVLPTEQFEKFITSLKFQNSTSENNTSLSEPINNSLSRITKKPFGLKVAPQSSPVSPERFSGYHTGTDFETTSEELNVVVEIRALCTGQLLQKRTASGYGGLAVQECTINNQNVRVVYGHIVLNSIEHSVGDIIHQAEAFAHLGNQGPNTDNERKHLHLGIHRGDSIDIKGYVQTEIELTNWIDYQNLKL